MKLKYIKKLFMVLVPLLTFNSLVIAQSIKPGAVAKTDSVRLPVKDSLINIGYGVQAKRMVTGAISTVKGEDLEKGFRLTLGSTLFGQLPGTTILQGGSEPGGSAPVIYGRGRNTFSGAGDQPLLIIDGFLAGGNGSGSSFMQLLPEEVETISYLKDAAATAVYGSRGANGVILVTTKRGQISPLQVAFTTRQGFSQAQFVPHVLGSYDYATLYNEALANDGLPAKYTAADLDAYKNNTDPYGHPNVDWYNEVLRKAAPVSSYDLTFRGGDKSVKYFVLLNALTSQGLFKKFGDMNDQSINSDYARYNFRANLDINLSKRLSVAFTIGGTVEQKNNPSNDYTTASTFNLIAGLPPNAFPVYNPNGTFSGSATYGTSGINSNPVGNLLQTGFAQSSGRTLMSSLSFTEQLDMITPGLSVSGAVSLNNYFNAGSRKNKAYLAYPLVGGAAGTQSFGPASSLTGTEESRDQYRNSIVQGSLDYKRAFGKSQFSAMGLMYTDNVVLPGTTGNATDPYIHNGGATRLTYAYNSRYIAEFTGGVTGSNNFPAGKRYGFFPAGSLGWIISDEAFLKQAKTLTFLKLRGSYGITGNDNVPGGRYQFTQTYIQNGTSGNYFFGTGNTNTPGYAESTVANPNITWEREKSVNIGLDATLYHHLDVSIDVYNRNRYDIAIIPSSTLPQVLGIIVPYYNQGKANDKGFEVSLRYSNTSKGGLQYFVAGNIAYAKNKILVNAEALQLNTNLYTTGYQIGQPYRLRAIGFFTQNEIDQRAANPALYPAPVGEVIRAGDIKYQDIGGPQGRPDGIIDGNDVVPTSNTTIPKLTAGLHSGFKYKWLDVDAVFEGVTQVTAYLSGAYFTAFQNNGPVSEIALGRWTPQTAGTATYPRLSSKNNTNNYRSSTFYERDGSFVKLRSAEVGYTFPTALSGKIKLKSARLFLTGTNLFSLDHIPYGDPESLSGYPVLRTITLGAKVQL